MPASSSAPAWQRAFIALAPDDTTRDVLARSAIPASLQPLMREDLHLTLAFLGGLSEGQRAELEQHLTQLPHHQPPLHNTGLAYWPDAPRARVLVATFAADDALNNLLAQIRGLLPPLGLPVEHRQFRPHITLARRGRGKLASPPALPEAPLPAASFAGLGLYARNRPESPTRYQTLWYRPTTPR